MARTRLRSYAQPIMGKWTRYNPDGSIDSTGTNVPSTGLYELCEDSTGRDSDHYLYIERREMKVTPLNGVHVRGDGVKLIMENFRPEYMNDAGSMPGYVFLPPYDLNALRLKTLANSNPSRADVSIGETVGELRSAPRAIYKAGRELIREMSSSRRFRQAVQNGLRGIGRNPTQTVGGGYLGFEFGVMPLVRDVKDLMKAGELIANRLQELENLRDGNGMRRKVKLDEESAKADPTYVGIHSASRFYIEGKKRSYASRRIWGTARWEPTKNWKAPDTQNRRLMEARRTALGLQIDMVTAWNLLPWSWLIDYFSSVGDLIEATNNTVGASPGNVNIMIQTIRAANITVDVPLTGISGGDCLDVIETKQRFVSSGFTGLNSSLPMLTGKQVSILGALAVSRIPLRR